MTTMCKHCEQPEIGSSHFTGSHYICDRELSESEAVSIHKSKHPYASLVARKVVQIASLVESLEKIRQLSTGWKCGNEGVHLLRINDLSIAALTTIGQPREEGKEK